MELLREKRRMLKKGGMVCEEGGKGEEKSEDYVSSQRRSLRDETNEVGNQKKGGGRSNEGEG